MTMRGPIIRMLAVVSAVILISTISGCWRGQPSSRPPIHPNPNMYHQEKYKPQAESPFFADGSAMRTPVPGTVARGELNSDDRYYLGQDSPGVFVKTMPVELNMELLKRGQERFDIYVDITGYPKPPAAWRDTERIIDPALTRYGDAAHTGGRTRRAPGLRQDETAGSLRKVAD